MTGPARTVAAVAAPLVWSNLLLPRLKLGHRGRTAANAAAATCYAVVFRARPHWASAQGLRYGLGCAAVVVAGYAAATAIAPLRRVVGGAGERAPDMGTVEWVGVHIPIGTVYTEELVFRATLDPLLDKTFGERVGAVLGASAFGLWHIHPARSAGDSVPGTVAFTTAAGLVLGALRRRADSATAPALLHWAVNAGGVLAARTVRRYSGGPAGMAANHHVRDGSTGPRAGMGDPPRRPGTA
ncbi:CPBP family intramembrane glutamic endopeptidase [Nocardia brevicatena]|uniref:CPBP family intramembrane glutamic endopeptidase n=1 Tax=Nocardia brevicatena TaxID=37327 RepID=UPI0002DFCA3F|nr:CPBP family intramembrane glutamic endopeptidase [Nocardia brevicatena]